MCRSAGLLNLIKVPHDKSDKAWLLVEVENKDQARQILPPAYRAEAKIILLHKFTHEEMANIENAHTV